MIVDVDREGLEISTLSAAGRETESRGVNDSSSASCGFDVPSSGAEAVPSRLR